uniref:Uncharacterized protein n=1 Tax=Anopheles dirus TaxID=7168 RepID=A0A182NT31_9DIPT
MPVTPVSPKGGEQFKGYTDEECLTKSNDLKLLRLRHSIVLRKIVRLEEDVSSTLITAATCDVKQQHLNALKAVQTEIFEQIVAMMPEDIDNDIAEDDKCGNIYHKLETVIANIKPSASVTPAATIAPHSPLLNIPMPTFDGTYEQWPEFKAMFMDIVERSGVSDAVKLHHLNKALTGKASGVLNASVIAGNNFDSAWQQLADRFENPRVIVDKHIAGLLQMKPLQRESARGLRELMKTCKSHVDGLIHMKKEIDGTSNIIVTHILVACLDPETRKLWERTLQKGEFPELQATLKFLCRQCEVLESCAPEGTERLPRVKPVGTKAFSSTLPSTIPPGACAVCKDKHATFRCPEFIALDTIGYKELETVQTDQLYAKAGFELRKWASNEPSVLQYVDHQKLASSPYATDAAEGLLATLGLIWDPVSDTLQFKIHAPYVGETVTKRKVLSCIARIYDPLGIVDPVKAMAKQFLQRIWTLQTDKQQAWGWDDELPPLIQDEWINFHNQLIHL